MNPKNIEANNALPNINDRLKSLAENIPSIQIERAIDLCRNATPKQTEEFCENFNNILKQEGKKSGINFSAALDELVSPIGVS